MLSADTTEEYNDENTSLKYKRTLIEIEEKILRESENENNYELAMSLIRGYARAAMEFSRVVRILFYFFSFLSTTFSLA